MASNDSRINIEWFGLDELKKFAINIREQVSKDIQLIIKQYALKCQEEVRQKLTDNKSVVTGNLRRSISVKPINVYTHDVFTNVEYAPYVEYGTRRSRAKPYFYPIYEEMQPKFKKDLNEVLEGYSNA